MSTSKVYADHSTIAVAVDKGKSSQVALKWAVEKILSPGQTITLVHVRDTYAMEADLVHFFHYAMEIDLNTMFIQGDDRWNPGEALKEEIEKRTRTKLEPFHAYCKRKNVESKEAVLNEKDVPKAISEYIAFTEISTLVIGGGSSKGLFKRFRDPDTANKVTAATPEFCSVYVVSKGKLKSIRNGTFPSSASSPVHRAEQAAGSSNLSRDSIEDGKDIRGFTRIPTNSGMSGIRSMSSLSDISFTRSGAIRYPNDGSSNRSTSSSTSSGCSDWSCNSMGSSFYAESDILSQSNADMMEAESRKLRLELMQKVNSYNAACNGALPAPQKVQTLTTK